METIIIPKPKYYVGDMVYHITPESDKGVIIDVKYHFYTGHFEYQVSFSQSESLWYYDCELSKNKSFA